MKLATYLENKDIRPSVFARRAGLPPSTVSRILKGARTPGLGVIAKIVTATDGAVTADDFLRDHSERAA